MQRSIEVWISQAVGRITPAIKLWAECYPLPVGKVAARRLYIERGQNYPDVLSGLLPFEGAEEAYWALRVAKDQAVLDFYGEKYKVILDMFGLKGPASLEDRARDGLWVGAFAYSLRGRDDTSLLQLVQDAHAWWHNLSVDTIQGRPRGSGTTWGTPEEFE